MIDTISDFRGVSSINILIGAGSSDLIFRVFPVFLNTESKVLILDPSYGEYIHVLENIVQCKVQRFKLNRENGFVVDENKLIKEVIKGYDLIIIVNPNSPTGLYIPKNQIQNILSNVPVSTLVWIDETYIEYAGASESLEQYAVTKENIIVCKSMSKVYALSGARVAYIVTSPHLIEKLKFLTPPWSISLPTQLAAITALKDSEYYIKKYEETHLLREQLKNDLENLGVAEIIPGIANFLLFYLPAKFGSAKGLIKKCRDKDLFLRDVSNMGSALGDGAIRIAVKDECTNTRMVTILKNSLSINSGNKYSIIENRIISL